MRAKSNRARLGGAPPVAGCGVRKNLGERGEHCFSDRRRTGLRRLDVAQVKTRKALNLARHQCVHGGDRGDHLATKLRGRFDVEAGAELHQQHRGTTLHGDQQTLDQRIHVIQRRRNQTTFPGKRRARSEQGLHHPDVSTVRERHPFGLTG